jgi:hypothetical protein
MHSHDIIGRTVYRFGAVDHGHFGFIVLKPSGQIACYNHPNESAYTFQDDRLNFIDIAGNISARLRYYVEANCFFGIDHKRLYLLPILSLSRRPGATPRRGPILVNSIPKSGTYLFDAALRKLDFRATDLHFFSEFAHDYRGVPPSEMHVRPDAREIRLPASALAHLLDSNEFALGHIDSRKEIDEFVAAGVRVLHCARDLRDVLYSLYRFKCAKVAPISPGDLAWRDLPEPERFLGFLAFYESRDIRHIRGCAETIIGRPEKETRIQFERILQGPEEQERSAEEQIEDNFISELRDAVLAVQNTATSTWSGKRSAHQEIWNDSAEQFFVKSGLAMLNHQLGYPLTV